MVTDAENLHSLAQSPREAEGSVVGDSNQRMPKNLPAFIKDAHFLLQVLRTSLSVLLPADLTKLHRTGFMFAHWRR